MGTASRLTMIKHTQKGGKIMVEHPADSWYLSPPHIKLSELKCLSELVWRNLVAVGVIGISS